MVPEILQHPVPDNLRLTEERSRQDDLGSNRGNDGDADADTDVEVQPGGDAVLAEEYEIQVLLKPGFSVKDVAERSGASLNSVRRVSRRSSGAEGRKALEGGSTGLHSEPNTFPATKNRGKISEPTFASAGLFATLAGVSGRRW